MEQLRILLQNQFDKMCLTGRLFRSNVSGQQVWETYLNSFKPEHNPVFRDPESSIHNCNLCKNIIRRYGNILSVNEKGEIESIFSNVIADDEYSNSVNACASLLEKSAIINVFFETYDELNSLPYERCSKSQSHFKLGIEKNFKQYTKEEAEKYGKVTTDKVYTFNHLFLMLPTAFVDKSGKSIEQIMASYRDKYNVFKRTMLEISLDTLILVKDLIKQGSLLDGTSHLPVLDKIITIKIVYNDCAFKNKDNWFWNVTYNMPESVAKFKNHLIGVLCSELAEGKELNAACESWNKRVDPVNYNKAKAPITEAQKKMAERFVIENGYIESFNRRLATMDDIKASEILHINRDNSKEKSVTIFDNIKTPSGTGQHKRSEFDKVEEVTIDKFMSDILPTCTNVELFFENKMQGNLVNLTTAAENSKQIFKWNNPFSYTFNGNLAGKSMIKENVKQAGGKIEGILRCSLQWNDEDTHGNVDFDLHCKESRGYEIYFSNKRSSATKGWLDVDMIRPSKIGIENITWQNNLPDMEYHFFVKNFCGGQNKGFKVEIEFDGNIFNYYYPTSVSYKQDINVAVVTVKNGIISIQHQLKETSNSRSIWNIETNKFHKVNLVCLTPNHWGNDNIGNKHYLFMLQGCKNDNPVRGFHNEHLISDLLEHRKVLDVLGNSALIEPTNNQLAGVGFNATVRDEIVLRLQGSHKRVVKIKI